MSTIRQITVSVIAGIILLIIQNLVTGWPSERLWIFDNHKIVDISYSNAASFRIEEIRTYNNRFLYVGDKFSYKSIMPFCHPDIPLSVSGATSYEDDVNIWCVCRDRYGGYYLQSPKVYIRNTQPREWGLENLYPGDEITLIIFVLVNQVGNEIFRQKVINGDWGRFPELPAHSQEIASIKLLSFMK